MPRNRVEVYWNGAEYEAALDEAIQRGMAEGALVVQEIGRGAPTRYNIREALIDKITAKAVKQDKRGPKMGYWVALAVNDFRSWWFEAGTLAGRRRKLAASTVARRNSPSGQARLSKAGATGVKAQRYMAFTFRAGWPRFLEVLGHALESFDVRLR